MMLVFRHLYIEDRVTVPTVSIKEAAQLLGVTEVTIRRRIRHGDLHAYQQEIPQGFAWMVEVPDDVRPSVGHADDIPGEIQEALHEIIRRQDERIAQLQEQLQAKDRQIGELHVLLQRAQAALPAPKEDRQSWWHRLWQRQR
jgi:hypothetical protein